MTFVDIRNSDLNVSDLRRPTAAPVWLPYTGAAIDLDFVAQKYWWGGAEKTTADFTTYALNGSTFDATGLTPSATIDVTLALAGLGTFIPGALAAALTMASAPPSGRHFVALDDGTTTERISFTATVTPQLSVQIYDGNVNQTNSPLTGAGALATRHGTALSYATNDIKMSANGTTTTQDVVATMPTVTTLRIGKLASGATNPVGAIARVVVFTAVKTQAELNALSTALRDNVVI